MVTVIMMVMVVIVIVMVIGDGKMQFETPQPQLSALNLECRCNLDLLQKKGALLIWREIKTRASGDISKLRHNYCVSMICLVDEARDHNSQVYFS